MTTPGSIPGENDIPMAGIFLNSISLDELNIIEPAGRVNHQNTDGRDECGIYQ